MYLVFIAVMLAVLAYVLLDMVGSDSMPFRCPRCGFGGDENIVGEPELWYARLPLGKSRCRTCMTVFKEHPNGSLVEDR